jgi:hypothetical protein
MQPKPPLVLTARLDSDAFTFFNALRQKYFPHERNFIDAHLTLFHALPNEPAIRDTIGAMAGTQSAFTSSVKEPVTIGKGVAFKIESPELMLLHKAFQNKWLNVLSMQDRQKLWPHVTVQNKVTPAEAQQLLQQLRYNFIPFSIVVNGLQIWEYLDGPWRLVETVSFKGDI